MQPDRPSSNVPFRLVLATALVLTIVACNKSDTSSQTPQLSIPTPAQSLATLDQCATKGIVIVGSGPGAKSGCTRVNASPSSATAQFSEIIVQTGGVLTLPAPAGSLHPLRVGDICLESGSQFLIGSATAPQPAASAFKIIFTGDSTSPGSSDPACQKEGPNHDQNFKKGIDVTDGATLALYGAKGVPTIKGISGGISWTTLVKPAGPMTKGAAAVSSGSSTLYLTADVTKGDEGWQPGDWIVVGTTDFSPFDTEFVQIASVASGSNGVSGAHSKVTLVQPLEYYHFGSLAPSSANSNCANPLYPAHSATSTQPAFLCDGANRNYGVDERAEVGLISRNITLTAETATIIPPSSTTNPNNPASTAAIRNEHWGGEIKIHQGFKKVAIQGVRLSKFGKAQLGSYPIHFHKVGHIASSLNPGQPGTTRVLIDADSVDHSYNKCVTIHETSNLTVSNMVCARIVGHIFYEELGDAGMSNLAVDSDITFKNDLGLGAMSNSFDIYGVTVLPLPPSAPTPFLPPNTYSRTYMIDHYWWTGDNMTNDTQSPDYINYDGFNIPDTDNQKQVVHGSCWTKGTSGFFSSSSDPTPTCSSGNYYLEPASGFWIQNPDTKLIGNAIGGCQGVGNGYWWVTPSKTINGSFLYTVPLGTVENDRAHACYQGFYIDASIGGINNANVLEPQNGAAKGNSALIANFDGLTATRNRFRGIWMRGTWYVVKNGHFATNRDNVSLLTSGGIDGNPPGAWHLLEDSVLIGLSENNPDRWGPCSANATPVTGGNIGGEYGCIDYTPSTNAHSGDIFDNGYPDPHWNTAGYFLYDGPVRVFHDRFVNFNYNAGWTSYWNANQKPMPCGTGAFYRELDAADCNSLQAFEIYNSNPEKQGPPAPYEGDAALGWFLANQNSYPTGTASKQLMFVNTNLRHQVFTEQVNIGNNFVDGDKNTSIIDEDGTLDGFGVQLASNSGTNPLPVHPISLNNLPFNDTMFNSVDECLSVGAQNELYEGRTSALMSPASMGTLQFSSLPGQVTSYFQQVTFARDDSVPAAPPSTALFHPTMAMRYGRNGLGSFEPKVSNGYGYTLTVAPTTAPGIPHNGTAGVAKWVDITLADIVDPNISSAHPFYVRLGIDYATEASDGTITVPPANTAFTVKRGYKSYNGGGINVDDPQLYNYWTSLPCTDLDANHPQNFSTCPAAKAPASVTTLKPASSISELTANGKPDGKPVLGKYYYNPTTGYLYLNIIQQTANPIGPSPTGSCDSAYDGGNPDPACPDKNAHETYYACPKNGCIDYTIAINDSTYTPGTSPTTALPPATADLKPAPSQQNKLVLYGTTTVVKRQIYADDQNVPYYKATNAPNACTITQPPQP